MADRECMKGFIVSQSPTDGEYVPFFIFVRDKDIIWDAETLTKNFAEYLNKIATDVELHYPMNEWKFHTNGWVVKVFQDGSYHAYKKVNIQDVSKLVTQKVIRSEVELPVKTLAEDFCINVTLSVKEDDLKSATVSYVNNEESSFDSVTIDTYANGSLFRTDFETSEYYRNQFMYITVDGNILFEYN